MSGIKRAALALHGLQADDQAWLMAQLDEAQRRPLRDSLDELASLGVPRDASLLEPLFAADTSHDRLLRAPASAVVGALQGQAIEVIALLLRLHPWPWRQAVLQQWAGPFMARPDLLEPHPGKPGPALIAALLDAVAARLDQADEGEQLPDGPRMAAPWWQRIWPLRTGKGRAA